VPQEPPERPEPGFLDVRALVQRAGAPLEGERSPREGAQVVEAASSSDASAQDAPKLAPEARRRPKAIPERLPHAARWTRIAIATTIVALLVGGLLLVLPRLLRDRVIAGAREAGVELSIGRVGMSWSGVSLRDVVARSPELPGVSARADEIFSSGFAGRTLRVRGLEVSLDGAVEDVGASMRRFVERHRAKLSRSGGRRVTVAAARLAWSSPLGEGTSLSAGEIVLDVDTPGPGQERVEGSVGSFEIVTPKTTLGPWAASFEATEPVTRARLVFDPPVPDGPSALFVWGPGTAAQLTMRIPRSPLGRLGLRPRELGLPGDDEAELEASIESKERAPGEHEGTFDVSLFGARVPSFKSPVDVALSGAARKSPGRPISLSRTQMTVGPFVARVDGTVLPHDRGFRLDATFRTDPVPCDKLVRAEARTWGPLAKTLQELAHATGAARVTGTAHATGVVTYDTKAPDDARVSFTTRSACGLSLFGL
jgi:hypothetical protein